MKSLIERALYESISIKQKLIQQSDTIEKIAREIANRITKGGKVILFGNGGSAADAQHIACELIGKFKHARTPCPAIALTTNTSTITAIANDMGFENIFERQVEALASEKDVVIGISTSGRSINVIKGIEAAKKKGAFTIVLTGERGEALANMADIAIIVPSKETPRIQEAHITIGHIICELVEELLLKRDAPE
jgi:D-sedoheptulose 7-phosphate isomerase